MPTIRVSFSGLSEQYDEYSGTTYYSGTIKVNGKKVSAYGNDRGGVMSNQLFDGIEAALGRSLTHKEICYIEDSDVFQFHKSGVLKL